MTTIRRAIEADIPSCMEIAEAAYLPFVSLIGRRPMPMDQDFGAAMSAEDLWVAETKGAVLGYVVAYPDDKAWMLENVAVHPSAHGLGIGRRLIAHVEQMAAKAGAEAVELYTNAKMVRNLTMYPALGYVEIGRAHQDGFDRVFYRKTV